MAGFVVEYPRSSAQGFDVTDQPDSTIHLLVMRQLFEAIPEEYQVVLYGHAADTLFGTVPFDRASTLLRRKRILECFPRSVLRFLSHLPSHRSKNLSRLAQKASRDMALAYFQIPYSAAEMECVRGLCRDELDSIGAHSAVDNYLTASDRPLIRVLREVAMTTDWMNSFREIELLAMRFDQLVYSPYLDVRVLDAARKLAPQDYFRNNTAKPVLRELAREYYDSSLIDVPKLRFEIPYSDWLAGPLARLVDETRQERDLFDGAALDDFDTERHFPLFWTFVNWFLITLH